MKEILELHGRPAQPAAAGRATQVLESEGVVVVSGRAFAVSGAEQALLDPGLLDVGSKNISLDRATGRLSGARKGDARLQALAEMVARFAADADALLEELTPSYTTALQRRRTSFRPGAIADRALSRRKDDRRLHVDAFPANPVQGRRILRVFANIDPSGEARAWDVGEEDFQATATRFARKLTARGRMAGLKAAVGVTRGRQTVYDQMMLQLHDAAKLDDEFQRTAPKQRMDFAGGSMWIVYTDAVMHAALRGQYALEQTYLLPVEAMRSPALSPLRTLERVTGRRLA